MDLRIVLDYLRRWRWLWVLVTGICLLAGFAPVDEISYLLAMPLIYLAVPMGTEFKKQGPMWVQRTLPIGALELARTGWFITVVLPVLAVVVSLVPASMFAWVTSGRNLASANLLPLLSGGILWTSTAYILTAVGNRAWRSKTIQILTVAGSFLLAAGFVLLLMKSMKYWGHAPLRTGLILGAVILTPVSYLMSPLLLEALGRNVPDAGRTDLGEASTPYAESWWDRMMAVPFWRTMYTGVWLLAFLFWMNLFYVLLSEHGAWWNMQAVFAMAPVGMQMMAMFLFLYSFAHVVSLRATAVLPISRLRRTLTVLSLPLAAAVPFTLCVSIQFAFQGVDAASVLQFAITMLSCLVTAYACLAICLRFGFISAIVGMMVIAFGMMLRLMLAGKSGVPELGGLDGGAGIGLILLAGIWIHRTLDRNPNVYRKQWIPAGLRRA